MTIEAKDVIKHLSEESIVRAIPIGDIDSLNFEKTKENLIKYEEFIGMTKEKAKMRQLYHKTNGDRGRYWLALSPEWNELKNSDFKISYWVNYGDNETYGRFTVEQIREWFNNPKIKLYQIGGVRERIEE